MARKRHHYRRRGGNTYEIDVTTFLNLMVVRDAGIEIGNGTAVIAAIPKKEGEYDFDSLSDLMLELKRERPEHEEASVLMESHIAYDYLIRTMDTVRSVELPTGVGNQVELFALFTEISVGDAP